MWEVEMIGNNCLKIGSMTNNVKAGIRSSLSTWEQSELEVLSFVLCGWEILSKSCILFSLLRIFVVKKSYQVVHNQQVSLICRLKS